MTELTLFSSCFVLVFALGSQSINVNNGHYLAAAVTRLFIGGGQLVLFKLAPNASWTEMAAFLIGGPFGIVASMWAHPELVRLLGREKKPRRIDEHESHLAPESAGMQHHRDSKK